MTIFINYLKFLRERATPIHRSRANVYTSVVYLFIIYTFAQRIEYIVKYCPLLLLTIIAQIIFSNAPFIFKHFHLHIIVQLSNQ